MAVPSLHRSRTNQKGAATTRPVVSALSVFRSLVGAATWISPSSSRRAFGLGPLEDDPGGELVGRLFGVRDLALGQAIRHRNAEVRRAALHVGVVCDSVDVVASLIARRRGAPKASGVLVGGGAAFFAALGLLALADHRTVAERA